MAQTLSQPQPQCYRQLLQGMMYQTTQSQSHRKHRAISTHQTPTVVKLSPVPQEFQSQPMEEGLWCDCKAVRLENMRNLQKEVRQARGMRQTHSAGLGDDTAESKVDPHSRAGQRHCSLGPDFLQGSMVWSPGWLAGPSTQAMVFSNDSGLEQIILLLTLGSFLNTE